MKTLKSSLVLVIATLTLTAAANDATYFTKGAQLIPLQESDIAIKSEVLTFTLTDDGYTTVDVLYEFNNTGAAKTVKMGFEAISPYNSGDEVRTDGVHPYIDRFTVEMNGKTLSYNNHLSPPINPDAPEEDRSYYYIYAFDALFNHGINRVHHTYRFRDSNGVGRAFIIPYWLMPATRWKGETIGDFTLNIQAPETAKHFVLPTGVFEGAEFKVTKGAGKVRTTTNQWGDKYIEIALRNGAVQWHKTGFRPTDDFEITSADLLYAFNENASVGAFYDRSPSYIVRYDDKPLPKRIVRNMPYANRGYVFKSRDLRDYFSKFFWYMPDPLYVPSTSDFTPREQRLLKELR